MVERSKSPLLLSANFTTTTINTTNLAVTDNLVELNQGLTGAASNDSGILIERGSTGNNAIIAWDESADSFIVGTTTATASDTGNLVSQIMVNQKSPDEILVESNATYSSFLEFGTSKMLARPFLFPATERSRPKIAEAVFNRVVKEIQRVVK